MYANWSMQMFTLVHMCWYTSVFFTRGSQCGEIKWVAMLPRVLPIWENLNVRKWYQVHTNFTGVYRWECRLTYTHTQQHTLWMCMLLLWLEKQGLLCAYTLPVLTTLFEVQRWSFQHQTCPKPSERCIGTLCFEWVSMLTYCLCLSMCVKFIRADLVYACLHWVGARKQQAGAATNSVW